MIVHIHRIMETWKRREGKGRVFELNSPRGSIEHGPRLWPRSAVEYRQLVKSKPLEDASSVDGLYRNGMNRPLFILNDVYPFSRMKNSIEAFTTRRDHTRSNFELERIVSKGSCSNALH